MKTQQEIKVHQLKVIDRQSDSLGLIVVLLIIFIGLAYMYYAAWKYADSTMFP